MSHGCNPFSTPHSKGYPTSRPCADAALAIPDHAALIFSAYCSGIRVDSHPPPACLIAAKSMSSSARSCASS